MLCTHLRRHNPLNIFAAHEITGFADPSVATKMTVRAWDSLHLHQVLVYDECSWSYNWLL